ncbi:MAG: UDP-N-acetylmuramoyl-L-alanyl-D-glutamate--2,6-diaminopimelate ligase [Candidatus Competibacter sp.]|nr:UDP-N-acetylmuramoyl-L-alanyl-D-glutamate--2,6-diaminopimelate ligase [Candidatus Competibacter sp.]MDG4584779.1 UDP-N-acetylmuramoyl-L-alanyl-D-glutamate--2,6-diaminopimelate ligase [Candidatus Competibacter sp.]
MNQASPLTLGSLLRDFTEVPAGLADRPIAGLASDSRAVRPGDLFFALRGEQRHGLEFGESVRAAGALAAVWEPPYEGPPTVAGEVTLPLLAVPELRQRMGPIASRFHGAPSRRLRVIGVTGTDGKTSCVHFIAQALSDAGHGPCGILGTLGVGEYGRTEPSPHTTPDPLAVQGWLARLVTAGRRHAAMEVSSHALDQGRVNGVEFAVAALTHLTRDHLDYHGTPEAYAAAKRRLFCEHRPGRAVLNLDDAFGRAIAAESRGRTEVIVYGLGARPCPDRFVWGDELELTPAGLRLRIRSSWGDGELRAGVLGRFNASNLLLALAVLLALDLPLAEVLERLARTATVPGRMERLTGPNRPLAVIDYAHTPHALEQALRALREHGGGRLWCVFGCGGDRDAGKRPLMGAVAERWADRVTITDDNPRGEDPQRIVRDIRAGMRRPEAAPVIHDRRTAIAETLAQAAPGDIVLIAGKGHEDVQIVGAEKRPFSDRDAARECLSLSPDFQAETA